MKLATHNSLSSYTPKKWWMRIFNPFAKCQSLTIEEQWDAGVRMFDIRVKPYTCEAAHGLIVYDISVLEALNQLNNHRNVVVRLCCENTMFMDYEKCKEWFISFYAECVKYNKNIKFCGAYMKTGWTKVLPVEDPEYKELYRTFNHWKGEKGWKNKLKSILDYICHPIPEYWSKYNKHFISENRKYNGYIMLDFVSPKKK